MSEAELLEHVKVALRITTSAFDTEIESLIAYAIEDMVRVGVKPRYIATMPPMVVQAITCYAKAQFGFDNPDADRFSESYYRIVANLLNSDKNIAAEEDESE